MADNGRPARSIEREFPVELINGKVPAKVTKISESGSVDTAGSSAMVIALCGSLFGLVVICVALLAVWKCRAVSWLFACVSLLPLRHR